jgi:hypothetical protein
MVFGGVGSWYDDVVVVLVVLYVRRYRVVGILKDSLKDVDALFILKIFMGLIL